MDPFCHHHRYGYISALQTSRFSTLTYTNFYSVFPSVSPVFKTSISLKEDLQLHSKLFIRKSQNPLEARKNYRNSCEKSFVKSCLSIFSFSLRSSPRPISIGQLIHYCIYTSDLSTLLSARSLTSFRYGIPYLEASFTLRCFQRLSQPHSATLPCRWRDNRCTVGAFIPVLSY